jgi:hypothetical protein
MSVTLEEIITKRVIPFAANFVVIVLFSHNLITRTPLKLGFSRWNVILRYRTAAFLFVVFEHISDFIGNVFGPSGLTKPFDNRDAYVRLVPSFISVISMWAAGVIVIYASLYRYERSAPWNLTIG